jgi:hypothetical protein
MTEKSRSDWRKRLFGDKYEEALEFVSSINFENRTDRSAILIIDLLDTFGALVAKSLSAEETIENDIHATTDNETPVHIYALKLETLINFVKIGFEKNLIKEVIPKGIYVDDYKIPVAVIAANGVEMYDLSKTND